MDAFGTNDGLDAYAAALGVTLTGDSDAKSAARLRASIYLGSAYEDRFVGTRPDGQFLSWPRNDATWPSGTAIAGIPDAVVYAAYEAAILEMTTPGILSPVVTPGKIKRRTRVEGAVDVEYYRDWASSDIVASQVPIFTRIEGLLAGLIGTRRSLPGVAVV